MTSPANQAKRSKDFRDRRRVRLGRAAQAEKALMSVVNSVRAYLPPDGIPVAELVNRVIWAVDNHEINPVIREIENVPAHKL